MTRAKRVIEGSLPPYLVATWLAAASALGAAPALAQPDPSGAPQAAADTPSPAVLEARAEFQAGIALTKQERWADALQAFERSDADHPHAITTYNIGNCERLLGHPTRAHAMFAKALADHQARGSVELPADLVSATQTYLIEAEQQIARVVVTITPATAVPVAVDGRPLELTTAAGPYPVLLAGTRAPGPADPAPAPTFEVDVDPGVHVFVLSVKGRPDVVANETLAAGRIAIELLVPAPAEATEAPKPLARGPEVDGTSAEKPNHLPAFVAFGIGAAALAAGAVSGGIAFGYKGPVNDACAPNGNPATCSSKHDAGTVAADVATASFITGGVAVGVGAILFFASGSSSAARASTQTSRGPAIEPLVGWRTLGLGGRF